MQLWSIGRYDLRLSDEEFWSLTPRQFEALRKRLSRSIEHAEMQTGIIASSTVNTSFCRPEKPTKPTDYMCTQWKPKARKSDRMTRSKRQHVANSVRGLFNGYIQMQKRNGVQ